MIVSIIPDVAKLASYEYTMGFVIAGISDEQMIVRIIMIVNCAHEYSGSGKKRRS